MKTASNENRSGLMSRMPTRYGRGDDVGCSPLVATPAERRIGELKKELHRVRRELNLLGGAFSHALDWPGRTRP